MAVSSAEFQWPSLDDFLSTTGSNAESSYHIAGSSGDGNYSLKVLKGSFHSPSPGKYGEHLYRGIRIFRLGDDHTCLAMLGQSFAAAGAASDVEGAVDRWHTKAPEHGAVLQAVERVSDYDLWFVAQKPMNHIGTFDSSDRVLQDWIDSIPLATGGVRLAGGPDVYLAVETAPGADTAGLAAIARTLPMLLRLKDFRAAKLLDAMQAFVVSTSANSVELRFRIPGDRFEALLKQAVNEY
jgi:hypothetical protein